MSHFSKEIQLNLCFELFVISIEIPIRRSMSEISTWSILRTRTLNLISIFGNLRYSFINRMKMLLHNKNLQKKMLMRLSITGFNTHKNKSSKYRQISIHSTLISWLIFCMSVTLLVFATDCLWFLSILTYHLQLHSLAPRKNGLLLLI